MSILGLICVLLALVATLLFVLFLFQRRDLRAVSELSLTVQRAISGERLPARIELEQQFEGQLDVQAIGVSVNQLLLRAARYRSEDARTGLVLTGDQIVTSSGVRDALAREFPDAACIDMETAAVAQVAHQNSVPWSALRVTSDSADETFDLKGVIGFVTDTAANLF